MVGRGQSQFRPYRTTMLAGVLIGVSWWLVRQGAVPLAKPVYLSRAEIQPAPMLPRDVREGLNVEVDHARRLEVLATHLTSRPALNRVVGKLEPAIRRPGNRVDPVDQHLRTYQQNLTVRPLLGARKLLILFRGRSEKHARLAMEALLDEVSDFALTESRRFFEQAARDVTDRIQALQGQLSGLEEQIQALDGSARAFPVDPAWIPRLRAGIENEELGLSERVAGINHELDQLARERASRPQSRMFEVLEQRGWLDGVPFRQLRRALARLEFQRFLHENVVPEPSSRQSEIRQRLVNVRRDLGAALNRLLAGDVNALGEREMALRRLVLETEKDVYFQLINGLYVDASRLSEGQQIYRDLTRRSQELVDTLDRLNGFTGHWTQDRIEAFLSQSVRSARPDIDLSRMD